MPWWAPLAYIAGFLFCAFYLLFFTERIPDPLTANRDWDSHSNRTRILDL